MNVQSPHSYQKVWKGAMILTIAGILTKVLSAAYRVPFQNIVGDVGFYIYQQVYPFFGVAMILATYGFPVVISKIVAEQPAKYRSAAARKIRWISFLFLSCLGVLGFLLLYFGAESLAAMMGDKELFVLIKIAAFSFMLVPLVSVWRGSFQGLGDMRPTAASQIGEQLVRVGTILLLAYTLTGAGHSLYEVGAGAIFGSVAGGISAVIILLYFYQKTKLQKLHIPNAPAQVLPKAMSIIKALSFQGFTICITSLLLILFQMVDAFTIYATLVDGGMNELVAKELKGVYDRGQPLIQLGTVVATAFSLSLVPFVILARNDKRDVQEKINLAIRVSISIGAAASLGLALLITPVNTMLFSDANGADVLLVLGLSILFCSISLTAAAILQGLGHPYLPALFVTIGIGLKFFLNSLLIPALYTLGAAFSTLAAFAIVALLLLLALKKKTGTSILKRIGLTPLLVSLTIMSVALMVYLYVTSFMTVDGRLFATVQGLLGVMVGGAVYLVLMIKNQYFTKEELLLLPLGKKLAKLCK
ncbi:putative cell division protein YtgP [Bacillus sp. THAF10]|uniref:putative polysaccharide biosynthesis protein n=1 Tax=Bacillus sp. THAF10 TaxID=2587848 RepID=UPI001267EE78|nr:oligosaccharide flippase family protein [Bacillus sp. THAF10]QFT87129.1 putative cell division protein YtgP [Bacillus sp. THAF10]